MENTVEVWHFLASPEKLANTNESVIIGKKYKIEGEPVLCETGYHGSIRIIDALYYAPGNFLCKRKLSGTIIYGEDKVVGTEMEILSIKNVEKELQLFARKCALSVAHLWNMPEVVKKYLETGDEKLRTMAREAAWAAAWATGATARGAAWEAALAQQNKLLEEIVKQTEETHK